MFEVGKTYKIRMIESGEEFFTHCTIAAYEHPLLKTADVQPTEIVINFGDGDTKSLSPAKATPGKIINVTSPNFISAQIQD